MLSSNPPLARQNAAATASCSASHRRPRFRGRVGSSQQASGALAGLLPGGWPSTQSRHAKSFRENDGLIYLKSLFAPLVVRALGPAAAYLAHSLACLRRCKLSVRSAKQCVQSLGESGTAPPLIGLVSMCRRVHVQGDPLFARRRFIPVVRVWQETSPIRAAFADDALAKKLSDIVGETIYLSQYPVRGPLPSC